MKTFLSVATLCAAFVLMGCQQPQTGGDDAEGDRQTTDSLMTAYEQAWESADASAFDALLASGFTRTVNTGESYGIDSLKRIASGGEFQDLSIDLGETVYGDDNAAVSWTLSGTTSGQPFSTAGASFVTFADSLIASEHAYIDFAPIMEAMMQAGPQDGVPADTTSM